MKQVEYIVYKEGNNWMVNDNGHLTALPYFVKTKKAVREYLINGNDNPEITIKITFA